MADAAYPETIVAISPVASLMGQPPDTMTAARKRSVPGGVHARTIERRHKRMIKNRESATRSRAMKQAYTNELENKVSRLEEENERRMRKKQEITDAIVDKPGGGTLEPFFRSSYNLITNKIHARQNFPLVSSSKMYPKMTSELDVTDSSSIEVS